MDIIIDEEKDIEYAENCIRHFENMSEEMKQNLCSALIRYCERFREFAIEADDDDFEGYPRILSHYFMY